MSAQSNGFSSAPKLPEMFRRENGILPGTTASVSHVLIFASIFFACEPSRYARAERFSRFDGTPSQNAGLRRNPRSSAIRVIGHPCRREVFLSPVRSVVAAGTDCGLTPTFLTKQLASGLVTIPPKRPRSASLQGHRTAVPEVGPLYRGMQWNEYICPGGSTSSAKLPRPPGFGPPR